LWDDKLGYQKFPYSSFNYAYKLDPNGTYRSLHGQRVSKVRKWNRDDFTVIEADLPRKTRVLTDLYLDSDEPSEGHILVILDMEVDSALGLPLASNPVQKITSIALEDRSTGEEYVFILDEDGVLDDYDNEDVIVINCHTEEELLTAFLNTWEEIRPTIMTGWNTDYFDIPYLYHRIIKVLGMDEANRLSPIRVVEFSNIKGKYLIAGISVLDYLDLYKKFTYTELPNYRLDTVAKEELGEGKMEFEGTLDDLFVRDIEEFLRYNLNDVRLVSRLDKKKKLIELVRGICTVGHVPYEDYNFSSRWLEGALLTDLHRRNIAAPNKPLEGREEMEALKSGEKGFEGAYVKEPKRGRHEWVFSLDLQSLYPSIIMSLNISPETKLGKIINWNMDRHIRGDIEEYVMEDLDGQELRFNKKDFSTFMRDSKFTISSNGILYRTDEVGLVPSILDRWFSERLTFRSKLKEAAHSGDKEQEEYYDMRQHIQKIFLNSLYGVLGLPVFRFYDLDNALAVTASGQDVIKTSAKYVNGKYNDKLNDTEDHCIYIDTDSLYFSVAPFIVDGMVPKTLGIQTAREMEADLNQLYNVLAQRMFFCKKHRFVIQGETIASSGFWVNKKRYALRKVYDLENDQDVNKVIIKGLDVVRSSFPAAFRRFMKEVLEGILDYRPRGEMDSKILKFRENIPGMPIPDVARNTAVKNITKWSFKGQQMGSFMSSTPAHVKAAMVHNFLLKHFNIEHKYRPITNGTKIKWVYLKDNPFKADAVAFIGDATDAPQIADLVQEYIDYDKIFRLEFSHKLQDFYTALNWGKIPTEINQKAYEFFDF
jgi:DNA polymerase elongation subunit (family B)